MTRLSIESLALPAAALGAPNPLPPLLGARDMHTDVRVEGVVPAAIVERMAYGHPRTILPYLLQDGYDRGTAPARLRVATLDNGILRATFLLDYGGRLWSLTDQRSERELVHVNRCLQPANLALRNAWFAGGVEWNVGTIGHSVHTCEPVHAARVAGPDGVPILRLYEYERIRGTPWQLDVYLPEWSEALYVFIRIQNPTSETVPAYWWTNIAVREQEDVRVLAPAASAFHFSPCQTLRRIALPAAGDDVSYATNASASADYFFDIPRGRPPWIAALDANGDGLAHVSTARLRGRKLFVWGMHQGGRRWQEFLSPGQPYLEIQAGMAPTQLEHVPMPPNARWSWVEALAPLRVDPVIVHGPWSDAVEGVSRELDGALGIDELESVHRLLATFADAQPERAIHLASGWGALERARRREAGLQQLSPGLPFPESSLGPQQQPWLDLLAGRQPPAATAASPPASYMVQSAWEPLLHIVPETWWSTLQLGVLRFASGEVASSRAAWEQSFRLEPNAWAARNLAVLAAADGDWPEAAARLSVARLLAPSCVPLTVEWVASLIEAGRPADALAAIADLDASSLPADFRLLELRASVEAGELDHATGIFEAGFEVAGIREGDLTLEFLWYETQARRMAQELDVPLDDEIRHRARATRPIPRLYDFRSAPEDSP